MNEEGSPAAAALAERLSRGARPGAALRFEGAVAFGEKLSVQRFSLDNGLKVLVAEEHSAPVVAYHTWLGVGSREEQPGKTGMAHLFEHLMFNETKSLGAGEFDRRMETLGAESNASTWMDWTHYHIAVPQQGLEEVVALEAERLANLVLSEPLLESEREVVINERQYRVEDDVDGSLAELLWSTAFRTHPYHWPTIGWMQDIVGLNLQDCERFYRRYYAPDAATIVVVGDATAERVLTEIQRHYGGLEAGGFAPSTLPVEPPQQEERRVEVARLTPTWKLLLGYRGPAISEPDYWALSVACELLLGSRSSPLVRALVREKQLATDLRGSITPLRDPGLVEISGSCRPGVPGAELLAAFDVELQRQLQVGFTEQELARACARAELAFLSRLDTADGKASSIGFYELLLGDPAGGFRAMDRIRALSPAEVGEAARRYLRPHSRTVVLGKPEQGEVAS